MIYLRIAVRNLLAARRRSLMLCAALGFVTFFLVLMLSLSRGLSETIVHTATTLSSGHINVSGFFKQTPRDAAPIITGTPEIRRLVQAKTPGLDFLVDRHRGWAKIVSETGSLQSGLVGIEVEEEGRFFDSLQLAAEREYVEGGGEDRPGKPRRIAEPGNVLLFANQAKRLGVRVGDQVTVSIETLRGLRNTRDLNVVAVARDFGFMSNWSLFMAKQTVLDIYKMKPDTSGNVLVYLKDIEKAEETMELLRGELAAAGYELMEYEPKPFFFKFETVSGEEWTGQRLDLTIWSDAVSYIMWIVTALDSISYFMVALLLLIIIVGIMNTMWISVRERTREIGTVRAIGMGRGRVMQLFLLEAAMLGLFATCLGGGLAAGLAAGIDAAEIRVPMEAMQLVLMSDTLHLAVRPADVIAAILAFTLVTMLAALWPALKASRMQPVTAIQHVG